MVCLWSPRFKLCATLSQEVKGWFEKVNKKTSVPPPIDYLSHLPFLSSISNFFFSVWPWSSPSYLKHINIQTSLNHIPLCSFMVPMRIIKLVASGQLIFLSWDLETYVWSSFIKGYYVREQTTALRICPQWLYCGAVPVGSFNVVLSYKDKVFIKSNFKEK